MTVVSIELHIKGFKEEMSFYAKLRFVVFEHFLERIALGKGKFLFVENLSLHVRLYYTMPFSI
jgi:hypothetical protein